MIIRASSIYSCVPVMANFSQFAMFIFIALFMMMTIASSKEPEPAFMQNKKRGERAEKAKVRAQKKRELKDKMVRRCP